MKLQLSLIVLFLFTFLTDSKALVNSNSTDAVKTEVKQIEKIGLIKKAENWIQVRIKKLVNKIVKYAMSDGEINTNRLLYLCLLAFTLSAVCGILTLFISVFNIPTYVFGFLSLILFWYWVYVAFLKQN